MKFSPFFESFQTFPNVLLVFKMIYLQKCIFQNCSSSECFSKYIFFITKIHSIVLPSFLYFLKIFLEPERSIPILKSVFEENSNFKCVLKVGQLCQMFFFNLGYRSVIFISFFQSGFRNWDTIDTRCFWKEFKLLLPEK